MNDRSPLENYYKTLAGIVKWKLCSHYDFGYGKNWDLIYNNYIIHRYDYKPVWAKGFDTSGFFITDLDHKNDGTNGSDMSPEDWGDGHWHTVNGYENLWIMFKRIDEKKWKNKKSLKSSESYEETSLSLDE